MTVIDINVLEARRLLEYCPKPVQDYVSALERSVSGWEHINATAVAKIRELSEKVEDYERHIHSESSRDEEAG